MNFKASLNCHVLRAEDLPKEASMVDYVMVGERWIRI